MRACSVKLYSDSKYFEREIKKTLALWIREHEPILRETEELEEREILSHVGILMMASMQRYLVSRDLTLINRQMADWNQDGVINAADLALLKRTLMR